MELRALSWNLFHGRDFPPEPELRTWRSRLLRVTERGATHAQVNRDLRERFEETIADLEWDVALLQECPPRWAERLAARCGADAHLALTSRNLPHLGGRLQRVVADLNPDLIASWEGGSNLTLVRPGASGPAIAERREHVMARRPERRVMAFTRLASGACVANLHASTDPRATPDEVVTAAEVALAWAGDAPLLFGGDLNLRPARDPAPFHHLAALGFSAPTAPGAIDHLLGNGLAVVTAPAQLPFEAREAPDPTAPPGSSPLPIRLSDHAPVAATFATGAAAQSDVQ